MTLLADSGLPDYLTTCGICDKVIDCMEAQPCNGALACERCRNETTMAEAAQRDYWDEYSEGAR